MFAKNTYCIWASIFSVGSYALFDWKEGSKILFLSAQGGGIVSRIVKKIPNEFMSFHHLGMIKEDKE